jgi:hypothetical protein
MHDPSLSQSRPRFGCLEGTFSPSRRQIRSTRFLFTTHPAWRRDPPIAIAAIPASELDDVSSQRCLVIGRRRNFTLRGTMLAKNPACSPLGNPEFTNHMLHAGTATDGA